MCDLNIGTWYQSSNSGLWYQDRASAGDVCTIKEDGMTVYLSAPQDGKYHAHQQIKHPADKSDPDRPETGRISGNDPAQKQVDQTRKTLEGRMI